MRIDKWKDHLEDWYYKQNYFGGYYAESPTTTFSEWFNSLSKSQVNYYLGIGRELYEQHTSDTT